MPETLKGTRHRIRAGCGWAACTKITEFHRLLLSALLGLARCW